jgi:hypothetical protein
MYTGVQWARANRSPGGRRPRKEARVCGVAWTVITPSRRGACAFHGTACGLSEPDTVSRSRSPGLSTQSVARISNLTNFGVPEIFDITDVKNPKVVRHLMLEIDDPANCARDRSH